MMGGLELLAGLQDAVDPAHVRVVRAPCMGRCDTAPVCEVGHRHVDKAGVAQALAVIGLDDLHPERAGPRRPGALPRRRRLRALAQPARRPRATRWRTRSGASCSALDEFRPARPGRRRLPDRPQVGAGPPAARAALHVRQRRRGRARHVQGPALPGAATRTASSRARSSPPASSRPSGCSSTCATSTRPSREILLHEIAALEEAGLVAARLHRAAPRGGRLHLRRGVLDDREHRGQARLPAQPPALRRPGRRCSGGRRWSTMSRRCSGCGTSSRRGRPGSPARAGTAARGCAPTRSRGG